MLKRLTLLTFLIAAGLAAQTNRTLRDADKRPISNAILSIRRAGLKNVDTVTDTTGLFVSDLPVGEYVVVVHHRDFPADPVAAKFDASEVLLPITRLRQNPSKGSLIWSGLMLALYWAIALLARYHNIMRVNQRLLVASAEAIECEIETATDETIRQHYAKLVQSLKSREEPSIISNIDGEVDRWIQTRALKLALIAKKSAETIEPERWWVFFFGMRGQIAANWAQLDEARRMLASVYTNDQVVARLSVLVEELRPDYSTMADKIEAVLLKVDQDPRPTGSFLRATLDEGLRCANENRHTALLATLNWQNKAYALIFIGGWLLYAMAALLENPILLLAGFIGGFASRLMRGKGTGTVSADATITWTNLFLSPIYGAIAAWAGILLLVVLAQFKIIGDVFERLNWNDASTSPMALGFALIFGFSERLFSAVADLAEGAVLKDKNAKAADPPAKLDAAVPKH